MNLSSFAGKIGDWPSDGRVGLPLSYFVKRGCLIDCRGPLTISASSIWGIGVKVLTESHDICAGPGKLGRVIPYGVRVDAGAWIGSYAVLAGCWIGEGAIVAAGSVVRGQTVAPGVIVAGNPARVVARWDGRQWAYLPAEESGFWRELT